MGRSPVCRRMRHAPKPTEGSLYDGVVSYPMAHPHSSLVSQVASLADVALLTLGARAAQTIQSSFAAIDATFLMKRVRYWLRLFSRTAGDDGPIIVGIAPGDLTTTEIAAAISEANVKGPSDTTQVLTQDNAWSVSRWSMCKFDFNAVDTEGWTSVGWLKAPGRGWAAREGTGWQTFAFNAGNGALETGSKIGGIVEIQGVWLRD